MTVEIIQSLQRIPPDSVLWGILLVWVLTHICKQLVPKPSALYPGWALLCAAVAAYAWSFLLTLSHVAGLYTGHVLVATATTALPLALIYVLGAVLGHNSVEQWVVAYLGKLSANPVTVAPILADGTPTTDEEPPQTP